MLGEQDHSTVPEEATSEPRSATSDAELAVAACRDPAAFEQLYLRYADRIFRFVVGQTGSTSLAEDIAGETMIAAFENLHRFDPDLGSFAAWLFTIARRRTVDEQRRLARLWRALSRRGVEATCGGHPERDRPVRTCVGSTGGPKSLAGAGSRGAAAALRRRALRARDR